MSSIRRLALVSLFGPLLVLGCEGKQPSAEEVAEEIELQQAVGQQIQQPLQQPQASTGQMIVVPPQAIVTKPAKKKAKTDETDWEEVIDESGTDDLSDALSAVIDELPNPAAPVLTSLAENTLFSTAEQVVAGACETGSVVVVGGLSDPQITTPEQGDSVECSDAAFGFSLALDHGQHQLSFHAVRPSDGKTSTTVERSIEVDLVAPAPVEVLFPAAALYVSGDPAVEISGSCESGALVEATLNALEVVEVECAEDSFAISYEADTPGTFAFTLVQTDDAGHTSSLPWSFVYDPSVPESPVISSPVAATVYSADSLLITGTCVDGYMVAISGATAAETSSGQVEQVCQDGFSFSIDKSSVGDGVYSLLLTQTRTDTGAVSAPAVVTYHYDTQKPGVIILEAPMENPVVASGPLAIQGSCEAGTTVAIQGDAVAASTLCSAEGAFAFEIDEASDDSFSYGLTQTDRAGNQSEPEVLTWHRLSQTPAAVTISSPASSSTSNDDEITVLGTCTADLQVIISGDIEAADVLSPSGSLSQICVAGEFAFTIGQSADGTYQWSFHQSYFGVTSQPVSVTWNRDTEGPVVAIDAAPSDPNNQSSATFTFSADGATEFHCQMDGGDWETCTSGMTYESLASGSRSFAVRAMDAAGNLSATPASHTWNQANYNTVALYHFDTAEPGFTDDASINGFLNLQDNGTSSVTGRYGQARSFQSTSLSTPDHADLSLLGDRFTVELWLNSTALFTSLSLLSQQAAGDLGFDLSVHRLGTSQNYQLQLKTSRDGTTVTTQTSNTVANPAPTWHHAAVTYDNGTVTFFLDGKVLGSSVGPVGPIHDSAADLVIGSGMFGHFPGYIDEVRISQTVRYSTSFTPSQTAHVAD